MSTSHDAAGPLVGRRRERQLLDGLVAEVRRGRSRSLLVQGPAGIGKTALLDATAAGASGMQVLRVDGVESELELAFAGVHQACAPIFELMDRVPVPQRDALSIALGLQPGEAPDRFLIGLAVLSLLHEASAHRPVLLVVDDLQWLDAASVQTLVFVARRLPPAAAVGILFGRRDDGESWPDQGVVPELTVARLTDAEARTLFDELFTGPVDDAVRDRVVAETEGNPLAMVQLARQVTPEDLAGGYGLPGTGSPANRVEARFAAQVAALPAATQTFLQVAAAEPGQDTGLVRKAAAACGVGPTDAEPAVAAGLMDVWGPVRFRHPLARSAVYRTASPEQRRAAHAALADAVDAAADPERRAWHRAHAAAVPDEEVAAELERCAARAEGRGGAAAGAAFREKAAELTPDAALRAARALHAAQVKLHARAPRGALRLLALAEAGPGDELARATAQLLRAQVAVAMHEGQDGPLLPAARDLEPLDPRLAWETYRDALEAARTTSDQARSGSVRDVAAAVLRAPAPPEPGPGHVDLLTGLALVTTSGYPAGAPPLRRAVAAFVSDDGADVRWLPLAARAAVDVWDDDAWAVLARRATALARRRGELRILPDALLAQLALRLLSGDLEGTAAAGGEVAMIAETVGDTGMLPYGPATVAAWRGRREAFEELVADADGEAAARGEGRWFAVTGWLSAVLANGVGRYEDALVAAEAGARDLDLLGTSGWSLVELVEAAARAGRPERATAAARRLAEIADACSTDWAVGVAARSRALLSDGARAEAAYQEATERLSRTRLTVLTARTRLVHGEWLRRAGRRADAREQLRAAHEMLAEAGVTAFADRARRELEATGETARRRDQDAETALTRQELQIARLAVDGGTNAEIAGQLFLSPRTVEWHLRKIFTKLGIARRTELRDALGRISSAGPLPRGSGAAPVPR